MKSKTSTSVGLRVPDDLLVHIDAAAKAQFASRSRVIVMALRQLYGADKPDHPERSSDRSPGSSGAISGSTS